MRYKKVIAIALCIGLFASCFNGVMISLAKNDTKEMEYLTDKAPDQNITELEPELSQAGDAVQQSNKKSLSSKVETGDSVIIYQGETVSLQEGTPSTDVYNIEGDTLKELLDQGFTIEEIYEADDIGNRIYVDPIELLKRSRDENISLKELEETIVKEMSENYYANLKEKYSKEYKRLSDDKMDDKDIENLLVYIDDRQLELSEDIIKDYKQKGEKIFSQVLSNQTREKYNLSWEDAKKLTDEKVKELEGTSKKTGKAVKSVIKEYIISISRQEGKEYEK